MTENRTENRDAVDYEILSTSCEIPAAPLHGTRPKRSP